MPPPSIPNNFQIPSNVAAPAPPVTPQNPPQQQPQQGQTQPNFWERAAPTIGGIVGGIGGELIDPFGGGIAGAAIGGALGRGIEDLTTHEKVSQMPGDILESAIANGLGQATGYGIAKGGGMLLKAGTDYLGGKVAANTAQAAEEAAAEKAANAATDKANIYGEAVKNADDKSIGANFQSTLNNAEKLGINTLDPTAPKLMSEVGHAQTGGNIETGAGALNEKVNQLIAEKGGNINLATINDELTHAAQEANQAGIGGELTQTAAKGKNLTAAGNPIQKAVQTIASLSPKLSTAGGTGLAAQQMTSAEADALAKSLAKMAFRKVPVNSDGFQDPEALAQTNIARSMYNYVRGEVDRQPGLGDAVKALRDDPQLEAYVDGKVANISDPAVQAATKAKILTSFKGANSIQDLRSAQAEAVQMSKLGDHVTNYNGERTYTTGAPKREPVNLKSGKGAITPTALDVASLAAMPFTHDLSIVGLAPHAIQAVKNPAVQEAAYKGLSKTVDNKTAAKIVGGLIKSGTITAANLPGDIPAPAAQPAAPAAAPNPGGGAPVNPVQAAYQQALAQEGNFADLAGRIPGNFGGTGYAGAAGTFGGQATQIAPVLNQQELQSQAVASLLPSLSNAGGPQGPASGLLTEATGVIPGTPANTFESKQAAAADALAKLLGISPQAAMSLLPQLTQGPQTAAPSTETLTNLIGGYGTQPLGLPSLATAQ